MTLLKTRPDLHRMYAGHKPVHIGRSTQSNVTVKLLVSIHLSELESQPYLAKDYQKREE